MFLKCEHLFPEDISIAITYGNVFFLTPFPSSWKNLTDGGKVVCDLTPPTPSPPRLSQSCVFLPDAWVEKNKETYRFLHLKS